MIEPVTICPECHHYAHSAGACRRVWRDLTRCECEYDSPMVVAAGGPPSVQSLLTDIRDCHKEMVTLKRRAYERYHMLRTVQAVADEEMDRALTELYAAEILLAQAEIDLLRHNQGS